MSVVIIILYVILSVSQVTYKYLVLKNSILRQTIYIYIYTSSNILLYAAICTVCLVKTVSRVFFEDCTVSITDSRACQPTHNTGCTVTTINLLFSYKSTNKLNLLIYNVT